jgi:hypothetical protein
MSNTATINISSPSGTHQVFLEQDADVRRTIHAVLDGVAHPLTECSANSDGTALKGNTAIRVFFMTFNDVVSVAVDPTSNAVTMDVSGANLDYDGVLNAGQAAALVAFVKNCGLPDLAA